MPTSNGINFLLKVYFYCCPGCDKFDVIIMEDHELNAGMMMVAVAPGDGAVKDRKRRATAKGTFTKAASEQHHHGRNTEPFTRTMAPAFG